MKPLPCNTCSKVEIRRDGTACTEDCPEFLHWQEELERGEGRDGSKKSGGPDQGD